MKSLVFIAMLCTACGPDWQSSVVDRYDIKLSEFETRSPEGDTLLLLLPGYLDILLSSLEETGLLDLSHDDLLGIVDLVSITVWPEDQISYASGVWLKPYAIAIRHAPADTMLRVFGHELIRVFEANDGQYQYAFQSSEDWSGEMGVLWNIAETTAVDDRKRRDSDESHIGELRGKE